MNQNKPFKTAVNDNKKIRLGILGGTGMAGREAALHHAFLDDIRLQYADITCITASVHSAGKYYGDVFAEKEKALKKFYPFWSESECPESLKKTVIDYTDMAIIKRKADYVISALDGPVAAMIEPELAKRGVHVFSKASTFRWADDVPLLIPDVNYAAIKLVEKQKTVGKQVCGPNCTSDGFVPLLYALELSGHNITRVSLNTYQALSGKGDDIASAEYASRIRGNVIDDWSKPVFNGKTKLTEHPNDEEWKTTYEPLKIFGMVSTKDEAIAEGEKVLKGEHLKIIPIYSNTMRVPVQYGHLECLTIECDTKVSAEQVKQELKNYEEPLELLSLPTTHALPLSSGGGRKLFSVYEGSVSPREQAMDGNGMAIAVGDFRQLDPYTISLSTVSHNLRRGACWSIRHGLELYLKEYQGMFK